MLCYIKNFKITFLYRLDYNFPKKNYQTMKKFLLNVIFIAATLSAHSATFTQKRTNLMSHKCTYCQKDDQLLKELQKEGFELKSIGHCYGVTLTFIKYLTNNKEKLNLSADALLDEFISDKDYMQSSHEIQSYQHRYIELKNEKGILELNPKGMKKYLSAASGARVKNYFIIPLEKAKPEFTKESLIEVLNKEQESLFMLGIIDTQGFNHCIALSTNEAHRFFYDSNQGIVTFSNIDEQATFLENFFKKNRFIWYATF